MQSINNIDMPRGHLNLSASYQSQLFGSASRTVDFSLPPVERLTIKSPPVMKSQAFTLNPTLIFTKPTLEEEAWFNEDHMDFASGSLFSQGPTDDTYEELLKTNLPNEGVY